MTTTVSDVMEIMVEAIDRLPKTITGKEAQLFTVPIVRQTDRLPHKGALDKVITIENQKVFQEVVEPQHKNR